MKGTKGTEKDFQTQANEYAHNSIGILREMLDALEHSRECDGEKECPECVAKDRDSSQVEECETCSGTGLVKCDAGKDSDEPEAWHDEERARARIDEDPLEIQVRGDWHNPGSRDEENARPTSYYILLTTGGPAARVIGELSSHGEPKSASFEYQDWFKPWTEAQTTTEEDSTLLEYAQQFYFGE